MSEFKKETSGYVAPERLWLATDGKIVREGDFRAWQLLSSRKGDVILERTAKRLGLDAAKIEPLQKKASEAEAPKPVAPEEIKTRATRPERVSEVR